MTVSNGQDLIVTTAGDTIHCRITSVAPQRLYYTEPVADRTRRNNIRLRDVVMYKREGYYPVVFDRAYIAEVQQRLKAERVTQRWLLAMHGGWSLYTADLQGSFNVASSAYIARLRQGFHAKASVHRFVTKEVALGFSYSDAFGARASGEYQAQLITGQLTTVSRAEDLRVQLPALSIVFMPTLGGKWRIWEVTDVGPCYFTDNLTFNSAVKITGQGLGAAALLAFDHPVFGRAFIGGHVGYFLGRLNDVKFTTSGATYPVQILSRDKLNLDRLDLGLSLSLRL
jgi:hypothetical protein